jgi:ATP-dependent Clp protease ATP-binding subunit ClpC
LNRDEKKDLLDLDSRIRKSVVGQDEAINKIVKSIRRNRVGIREHKKPIGSFVFLGSTGVGKTHLAKTLATKLFGGDDSLIRVDMSEYSEKFNSSRLIGSPPGYVGYSQGGQLTEAVRKKPYSVVLFDEIEKAHPDIFDLLLQVLDDGTMTDGLGRKINFKNTLIIMTSNIGVRKLQDFGVGMGFSTSHKIEQKEEEEKQVIKKAMKDTFSPEFLNRIDETIIFNSLDDESMKSIVGIELNKLSERLKEKNYSITFNVSVVNYIASQGFDDKFGARPISRAIQNKVEDFISEQVLKGDIIEDKRYSLSYDKKEEKIKFKPLK